MPSFDNDVLAIPQVAAFADALNGALEHARRIKPISSIEPALTKSDFDQLFSQLPTIFPSSSSADDTADTKIRQYVAIETAVRQRVEPLLATTPITSPEFVEVWNILDILAALSDSGQCEPALLFSLIEVLVDNQTIAGCRIAFDYYESRRERIMSKLTQGTQIIVLRTCNELLRRLSRAEDIAFSGQVKIFMFQSFPMGDKGIVNLRGQYHTENVTTFEEIPPKPDVAVEKMDLDTKEEKDIKSVATWAKAVTFDSKDKPTSEKTLDTDTLYPVFWSLQQYFSQPTKLFDAQNLAKFKSGLEATMAAFDSVALIQRSSKSSDDTKDASKKRKRFEVDASGSGAINPKYLTSRDLFELEMSDLFFRRHILIQAIIVLDFLRSLTPAAKAKLANIQRPNSSVTYSDKVISEEDDKWAENMRNRIYEYIFAGPDGQYVHRIIQAVTQRDKGWTRWKIETCPPIQRPAVTPAEFNEARGSAKRMATSKKLRPHPMGSLNLDFLKPEDDETAMEKFKDPARWKLPDLATFKDKIAEDDLELDFAKNDNEKAQIMEAKASKTWRALRIARRTRLAAFDKIEDWTDIKAVFEDPKDAEEENTEEEVAPGRKPVDKRPIIVSGPSGVGKSVLVDMLLEREPGVFQKIVQHTTRKPKEGEVNGQDYHFIDSTAFNIMLDGDQLLESTTKDGVDYGTNRRTADSVSDSGKVPLMQLDRESVQSAKDNLYSARIIFVRPPSIPELESRLKMSDKYAVNTVPEMLKAAEEEDKQSVEDGFYDVTVVNDDVETAYKALEEFIYGIGTETNGVNGDSAAADVDVAMNAAANVEAETNGA
ncbi:guanylate kinase [Xylariales sp. AK1849]|nr:guanylate kinase [Xylariales sp. AK1849]